MANFIYHLKIAMNIRNGTYLNELKSIQLVSLSKLKVGQ